MTRPAAEPRRGTVVEVHGIRATVLLHGERGRRVRCRPPRERFILAVGDRVRVLEGRGGAEVVEVEERRQTLWRPQAGNEHLRQVMAAHVDRLFVVLAAVPEPRPGLVDRFLVAADAEDIEASIILNKMDLPEAARALEVLEPYRQLGCPVWEVSAQTGAGLGPLREALEDGFSVFVGHSGVGKSTLLNALVPGAALVTGEVNEATGRGRHTTSVSTCHPVGPPWPEGGLIADTPGVRAFSLAGTDLADIGYGFRDLRPYRIQCRFRNCLHEREPGCAVVLAAERGEVDRERYASYLRILDSVRRGEG